MRFARVNHAIPCQASAGLAEHPEIRMPTPRYRFSLLLKNQLCYMIRKIYLITHRCKVPHKIQRFVAPWKSSVMKWQHLSTQKPYWADA